MVLRTWALAFESARSDLSLCLASYKLCDFRKLSFLIVPVYLVDALLGLNVIMYEKHLAAMPRARKSSVNVSSYLYCDDYQYLLFTQARFASLAAEIIMRAYLPGCGLIS